MISLDACVGCVVLVVVVIVMVFLVDVDLMATLDVPGLLSASRTYERDAVLFLV